MTSHMPVFSSTCTMFYVFWNYVKDSVLQTLSKMGAHYHCIICSATIVRRTDMIGHINRHVNKGETESRFITGELWLTWNIIFFCYTPCAVTVIKGGRHRKNAETELVFLMKNLPLIFQNFCLIRSVAELWFSLALTSSCVVIEITSTPLTLNVVSTSFCVSRRVRDMASTEKKSLE